MADIPTTVIIRTWDKNIAIIFLFQQLSKQQICAEFVSVILVWVHVVGHINYTNTGAVCVFDIFFLET